MTLLVVAGLAGVALATLALALAVQVRQRKALQRQLDATAAELQQLQFACARLAPAGVVNRLVADGDAQGAERTAERKVATALFADLVGFTALGEQLEPAVLARILNAYFQRMSDALQEHRGHLSTFLGDGLLAYFGAIHPNAWQCDDAVRAALAMRESLRDYNVELAKEGLPQLALGIGIHRGPGLAGFIGSRERMEYGFVGPTVNLAARVQSLTRQHGVDILVTEALRDGLDAAFELEPMPAESVKGIAEPVVTYAVRGPGRAAPASAPSPASTA
ncbi:MAG: adenylate/guanylate cyclase domain-containing protein [Caldimonas sp.]